MKYMNKSENKFTVKVTRSSQNAHRDCELIVNQNTLNKLIYSNINMNLRNKQEPLLLQHFFLTRSGFSLLNGTGFVRSLFALCSLIVRFIGEGRVFNMDFNSN